jgi:peptidoglycan/xylan/chitin deacetylase (PgdA/CDA1 family)
MLGGNFLARVRGKYRRTLAGRLARRLLPLRNTQPIVSFTFDDAPMSAFIRGREILESYGARGTYFVSLGLLGATTEVGPIASPEELFAAREAGHELGCHTYDHLDAWLVPPDRYVASIEANSQALQQLCPDAMFATFAYPKSGATLATKREAARRFECCRGGGQSPNVDVADLALLKACFLDRRTGLDVPAARSLIDYNADRRGWLIFATHDISHTPTPFGIAGNAFDAIVAYAARTGAALLPVAAAHQFLRHASIGVGQQ